MIHRAPQARLFVVASWQYVATAVKWFFLFISSHSKAKLLSQYNETTQRRFFSRSREPEKLFRNLVERGIFNAGFCAKKLSDNFMHWIVALVNKFPLCKFRFRSFFPRTLGRASTLTTLVIEINWRQIESVTVTLCSPSFRALCRGVKSDSEEKFRLVTPKL